MPKLAIIDQIVSAGGVERFLHGLVGGMLELPEIKEWDITILLNRYNSGGYKVEWPEHLTAPNVRVAYMFDVRLSRLLNWMSTSGRIWGIYGTGFAKSRIPWLLQRFGPGWIRKHAGDARLWIEHYCQQQHFDVVYFSYPYLMECPKIATPMVATPHDFNFKTFNTLSTASCSQIERQMAEWLRRSRRLVVSSEFMAGQLRHFYPEFADKVRVVRLGIPSSTRIPVEADLKAYGERSGLPQRFLLTVGWIVPHKNQRVIFEALGLLRQRGVNIPLVCVGPNSAALQAADTGRAGDYVAEILKLADKLGLRYGRDFFGLGYVSDFELECLYRLATALVMPSLYEAGSFPAAEATRVGCPVACSRIPSLVEQSKLMGDNIWLFDPHDATNLADTIEGMLKNTEATAQRAGRAAETVGQVYSWKKAAAGYLSVFREVLGTAPEAH